MRVDIFWHRWNRKAPNRKGEVEASTIETSNTSLVDILADFRAIHGTTGSHHTTGIFEIQTDTGIWRREDGNSFATRIETARFTTWEELEALEEAGVTEN